MVSFFILVCVVLFYEVSICLQVQQTTVNSFAAETVFVTVTPITINVIDRATGLPLISGSVTVAPAGSPLAAIFHNERLASFVPSCFIKNPQFLLNWFLKDMLLLIAFLLLSFFAALQPAAPK